MLAELYVSKVFNTVDIPNHTGPISTTVNTNWRKLQSAQNGAIKAITGCSLMSHEDSLPQEKKLLSIKGHNILPSDQYTISEIAS